jgi:hypothetical protein
MTTTLITESILNLTETNRLAAEKILPHYAPFGIRYLKNRESIAEWTHRHWARGFEANELPTGLRWAVGIEQCHFIRADRHDSYEATIYPASPGLFWLSEKGSFMEWRQGLERPTRILGHRVQTDMHLLQFVTQNCAHPDTPVFMHLFTKYSEEFCDNWSFEQLEALRT